jgi:hypothetical protein
MNTAVVHSIVQPKAADLDQRIAGAFREGTTSDQLTDVIGDVEAAAGAAGELAEKAHASARPGSIGERSGDRSP